MLCSYTELLGFQGESAKLSDSTSPLHVLARKAGVSPLGTAIDIGAFISMSACVLACTIAASRVMLRNGLTAACCLTSSLAPIRSMAPPGAGVLLTGTVMLVITVVLAIFGCRRYRHLRLAGLHLCFRFPNGVRIDGRLTPIRSKSSRTALRKHCDGQLAYRSGSDCILIRQYLPVAIRTSNLVPLHLSRLHGPGNDLVPATPVSTIHARREASLKS